MENACGCGQSECDQCQGDMESALYRVFRCYLTMGPKNDTIREEMPYEEYENVTQFMVVSTEICKLHFERIQPGQGQRLANRAIVNALQLLFNTLSNSNPTTKVSHCGLLRMATFPFMKFPRDERIPAQTLCSILIWICNFMDMEKLTPDWNRLFLAEAFDTLILHCIHLVGEMLYSLPHLEAFNDGYMNVIRGVLALGSTIAYAVFLKFPTEAVRQRFSVGRGEYRTQANLLGKKLVNLLEVLRLHKVLNIYRAYNGAPRKWPVPRKNEFLTKISAIPRKLQYESQDPFSLVNEAKSLRKRCFRVLNAKKFPRRAAKIARKIMDCVRYEFYLLNVEVPPDSVADAVALANMRRSRGAFRVERARRLLTTARGCGLL